VGDLKQAVTVEETPSPVNLSTQQTSGLVGERQVRELLHNGRSYDELMTLNAAVVNYVTALGRQWDIQLVGGQYVRRLSHGGCDYGDCGQAAADSIWVEAA
jgi:hypothetical protein